MNIELNSNQRLMGREARRFLLKECSSDSVHAAYDSEKALDRDLWQKMVALDWMALTVPEAYGGVAADLTDICVLMEEMGRALLPGPYFSSALLSSPLLMEGGTEKQKKELLPKIANGELIATLALHDPKNVNNEKGVIMQMADGGVIIRGTKYLVPYAGVADVIFVPVYHDNDHRVVTILMVETDTKDIECWPLETIDGSRQSYAVRFHSLHVPFEMVIGKEKEGRNMLDRVLTKAMVGLAAENIGGAQVVMEKAINYAKDRVQFEKPIGSFQVIKHQCADMKIDIDGAEMLMYYAAWACENDMDDSYAAALAAYVNSSEMYGSITDTATHIHGALGVTWENEMHLYYKRAWANKYVFGEQKDMTNRLADEIIGLMEKDRL